MTLVLLLFALYIPVERIVTSKTNLVDFDLLQEYRDNPTLTAKKAKPSSLEEIQLKEEIEKELKLMKAEAKKSISPIGSVLK